MAGKPRDYYKVWEQFVVPAEERTRRQIIERSSQTNETLRELADETSRQPAPVNVPAKEIER